MKKFIAPAIIVTAALALGFAQTAAAATSSAKPETKQQSKFSACAHKSKGMKGEAHKKFMSDCLKGKTDQKPDAAPASPDKKKQGGGK
ncbi:MAG: PsiF family protein [Gammaproteobacteria bacterium]